jgi:hypothetical protein
MLWAELLKIIQNNIKTIGQDKVRIYDEHNGGFLDADVIEMEDDDVIDKHNLFIWLKAQK